MEREWKIAGRYGYWMVDEYRPSDSKDVVYNSIGPFTKKLATQVASALNKAYQFGRQDLMQELATEARKAHALNKDSV